MRATDKVAVSDQATSDQAASDQAARDEVVDDERDDAEVSASDEALVAERDDAEVPASDEALVAEPDRNAVLDEASGDVADGENVEDGPVLDDRGELEPLENAPDDETGHGAVIETVAVDDAATGDRVADDDAVADVDRPGQEEYEFAGLWPPAQAHAIRERWREVQLRFVDDPQAAAVEAATLVDDAAQVLVTAIESRRTQLGAWRTAPPGDTEQLRLVVQRYREFVDAVLGV